jgi:flagellar hook-basal body complex protein FliE
VAQGVNDLVAGKTENIHELAIQVAQADVAFRLVMEVRDKLISAYQEMMRMQI